MHIVRQLHTSITRLISLLFLVTLGSVQAFSWGSTGHKLINLKAPLHLPATMAIWKADSLFLQTHASDADYRKVYSDTNFYAEYLRHYIDLGPGYSNLPHRRDAAVALYGWNTVKNNGTLPWATVMVMDSLTAQYRRGAHAKADSSMADLGHYVGDGHQPLHCTVDYDGQLSGHAGIHSRYETDMIGTYKNNLVIVPDSAQYVDSPIDYIFSYIEYSNSLVDSIFLADSAAKAVSGGLYNTTYYTELWQRCGPFTQQLFQSATVHLASLWYTAWVNSQAAPPPSPATILASLTGAPGTITPSGIVTVPAGRDTTFAWSVPAGYHLDSVVVDGNRVDSLVQYTFHAPSGPHSITVRCSPELYAITLTVTGNGTVSPGTLFTVPFSSDAAVTFRPDTGWHVDSVICDGQRVDSVSGYTFRSVSSAHHLGIWFGINHYTITVTGSTHGTVSSSGVLSVPYDTTVALTFTPDSGYYVREVRVDGLPVDSLAGYTFRHVASAHSLSVIFGDRLMAITNAVSAGWNLISLPVLVPDGRTSVLFREISSRAYAYSGVYAQRDTLVPGTGYWVKFTGASEQTLSGTSLLTDTIPVAAGWNLIGSISVPVAVAGIRSIPGGMTTSQFFGYSGRYSAVDSIRPGGGYWVKTDQPGVLILDDPATQRRSAAATVIQISRAVIEPPAPPAGPDDQVLSAPVPSTTGLITSYPNPFNPSTQIRYQVSGIAHVSLRIYSLIGQEIATLVDAMQSPGYYTVRWDASGIAGGVYILRMTGGSYQGDRKLMLVR